MATLEVSAGIEVQVGRDPACDLVLPSAGVSRRHASLRFLLEGIEVNDRGSATGVRIQGQPARGLVVAKFSDSIEIGEFTLSYEASARRLTVWPTSAADKPRLFIAAGVLCVVALIGVLLGARLGRSHAATAERLESQALAAARAETEDVCARGSAERCAAMLCRLLGLVPQDEPTRARLGRVEKALPPDLPRCSR